MEPANAFIGCTEPPSPEQVARVLGPGAKLWDELVDWMATGLGVTTREWKGVVVHKYGWTLRLLHKKRTIVYLSPCAGCFRVAFTLSDKAVAAARSAGLSKQVLQALAEAPRYPEGTGLRLLIKKASDLAPVRTLAGIKLAN